MTYIAMNMNQRINYKANQMSKAKAIGSPLNNCLAILKSAWEDTGDKAHTELRTYSRSSRRHFK